MHNWFCTNVCFHALQDAHVFVSENDAGVEHSVELGAGRQAYLVCIEGSAQLAGPPGEEGGAVQLEARDAAALVAGSSVPLPVTITAGKAGAHLLLIEMKQA